ncbi:MAG TPA: DUF1385 domain-containing protein [Solirubrobacterales bacterium]|jgi:uncharacterized protein YqhQ|nr:DUF1385 domain-containing protein [Solirubrobacterales bacterium]
MTASPTGSSDGAGPEQTERLRLGGMALRNGLLIHGPTAWAIAARTPDGRIESASGPKPSFAPGRLGEIPMLRGPLRLAEALAVIPLARARLPAARLPFEDRGVLAAVGLSLAASGMLRRGRSAEPSAAGAAAREAVVALLGTLPAVAALRDRDLASYHGVEHKAIGGYEVGADPAEVPKEHRRCGSNLIVPMLALSIAGQVLLGRALDEPGPLARGLAGLAGVGAAVELFVHAERNPDSAVGRAVHGLGYEIQRLISTRDPTPEQLDVGRVALHEVLRAEAEAADTV